MKHRIAQTILKLAQLFFEKRWFVLSGVFASLLATFRLGRPVKVWWDGEDWIYQWKRNGAVEARCDYSPLSNWVDIDLFFFAYKPKAGEVIVDVGVENGAEIPSFCESVGERGAVYAIEADPQCCRRLRKLKALLKLNNLTIIEAAVGASSGQMAFTQNLGTVANRIVAISEHDGDNTIRVQMDTLPRLLGSHGVRHVDYLKVNIEGAEVELFKGMQGSDLCFRHACISCHDFIGDHTKSYDFVYSWLKAAGHAVSNYSPRSSDAPWRNYYLYAGPTLPDVNPL